MNILHKNSILLLALCHIHLCVIRSQTTVKNNDFESSSFRICELTNHQELFHKSIHFFSENQIDSTYLYTSRFLQISKNKQLSDYAYYIQAASAERKKLLDQAEESLKQISNNFDFKKLKNLRLATVLLSKKQYKEALEYYKKWEEDLSKHKNEASPIEIYHNIGVCYLHLKNFKKATIYLYKERDLAMKTNDTLSTIYATMDIANLYYEQYLDDKAIPLFVEAYTLAKNTSNHEIKQNTALNMAVVEENRKNFKKSVAYRKEYEKWKDSIWNRDKIWELAKHEQAFAVAQKQKEIELQEKQIEIKNAQQNILFIGIVSLFIIIAVVIVFLRQGIKKNRVIVRQKNRLVDLNETKNKLFSIVSHDLKTPINTIRHNNSILKESFENNDYSEVKEKINEGIQVTNGVHLLLDKVLNWSLLESGQLFTTIEPFPLKPIVTQIIYSYQTIIDSKNIKVINNALPSIIVNSDIESTKVVLRNLLDNAIKYSNKNGSVLFETSIENNSFCHLKIIDNGIGISEETLKSITLNHHNKSASKGFGLRLCMSLLKNSGGDLKISSSKVNGTTISVVLPLKNNNMINLKT